MIHFVIVGCGSMANFHAQTLKRMPDVRVVALVDIVASKTKVFRDKYFPDAAEFISFDDLIKHPPTPIDAVVLVTPHTIHYPHAKAAMKRGWHVLCEKPMVTALPHAYDLWRTSKRTGRLMAVSYQSAYSAEFGYLAAQRDAGQLGKPQTITAHLSQSWLKGTTNTWRQDPKLSGGGQMYDSGAHALNAIMWLMDDPVVEVGCFVNKCSSPVDINGVAIARFKNGALASITIGGNCPAFRTEILLQTDTLQIITDMYGGKLEMYGRDHKRIYPHVIQDFQHPAFGSPHLNFVKAMLGQEPLRAPVRYGVLLSALMDAMYQSADTGKMVKVKPVPKKI